MQLIDARALCLSRPLSDIYPPRMRPTGKILSDAGRGDGLTSGPATYAVTGFVQIGSARHA